MLKKVSALIFVLVFVCAVHVQARPKVLLIESYHAEYAWDQEQRAGLESVFQGQVEFFDFEMDTKRLPTSAYMERADQAWLYYLKIKPDVVVLSDDNAMMLLAGRFLKTKTPVVYMGINNNPRNYAPLGKNITGVLERPLYKRTVSYLKELLKIGDGKVLILLDKGTTSEAFKASVFKDSDSMFVSGIETDILLLSSFDKWKQAVKEAQGNGYKAIVIGLYHRIFKKGIHVASEDVLEWTSEHSPVPVFAFWEMSVGKGKAVGGMVMSGEEQGRAAGKIVMEILGGSAPCSIAPVIPTQGDFVFSRHELERWKIRLPRYIKEQARILK
ncbi:ABC transporter substrate-binding protein [Maridesulfovibrio sp.]|uniref:ABC transporter substrate-binding protein n=1 Tax=Maridesulfovibrio sp. TaxID=2795000 RepID=UPI003BA94F4D